MNGERNVWGGDSVGRILRNPCREGVDMDFFITSMPGSGTALVGHGVSGTYLPVVSSEAPSPCQDTSSSGERFLVSAPNIFFMVAPIELRDEGVSPSCPSPVVGLASRHF